MSESPQCPGMIRGEQCQFRLNHIGPCVIPFPFKPVASGLAGEDFRALANMLAELFATTAADEHLVTSVREHDWVLAELIQAHQQAASAIVAHVRARTA